MLSRKKGPGPFFSTFSFCYNGRASQKEVYMRKGTKLALILGAIPFITLVFALPLVNRIEPMILGLPFLLFWILFWVILTPLILFVAYILEKKYNPPDEEDES
jgi:hypothetical protein